MTIGTRAPWRSAAPGATAALLAALTFFAGGCDLGTPITLTRGTEVEGLTGTLVAGGGPAAGARVMLFETDTSGVLARGAADEGVDTVSADADGRFSFEDIPHGSYNLSASLRLGDTTYALFLGGLIVDDDTDIGIRTLLAAGRVVLQAVSDGQSVEHAVCAIPGSPWSAVSDSSGTCVLDDVAPGTFQITVTHPSFTVTFAGGITVPSGGSASGGTVELEPQPEVLTRLIAHWGFDEAAGAGALDASGNGRHGVISGPANRVPGVQGTALEFNGSTDVRVADSLIPDLESFTLAAWVWEPSPDVDQPIFDFCCTNDMVGLHLWTNTVGSGNVNPGRIYVNLRAVPPANNLFYTFAGPLSSGSWDHVALTYDAGTRKAGIHVNGALHDTLVLPQGQKPNLSGMLYLGYREASAIDYRNGARFTGRLDEVRIYDGALTATRIDSLYRAFAPQDPLPEAPARLVAHWDFNEGAGTILQDRAGGGHDGDITSAEWAEGVRGTALSFDGSTSEVVVPFSQELNLSEFTLSAWIKTELTAWQSVVSRQAPDGQQQPWNYRMTVTDAAEYPAITIPAGHVLVDFWPQDMPGPVSTVLVADGRWHNLTAAMRGTILSLYVDGVLSATVDMGMRPDTLGTEPLHIGSSAFANERAWFQGLIDEVRLYDGTLTATQIDSLYRAFRPASADTVTISSSADAGTIAPAPGLPSTAHVSQNYGLFERFGTGAYDPYTVGKGLVRFDLPADIDGSRIARAVLRMHTAEWVPKDVQADSTTVFVHRLLRDWKEGTGNATTNSPAIDGVTGSERFWGTQDGSEDWNELGVGLDDVDAVAVPDAQTTVPHLHAGAWEFDVTEMARIWADAPESNYGAVLAAPFPSDDVFIDYPVFHTREADVTDDLKPTLILYLEN